MCVQDCRAVSLTGRLRWRLTKVLHKFLHIVRIYTTKVLFEAHLNTLDLKTMLSPTPHTCNAPRTIQTAQFHTHHDWPTKPQAGGHVSLFCTVDYLF